MGRSGGKDPKLSEVKAVLQRLQGIGAEGESDDLESPPPARGSGTLKPIVAATIVTVAVGILGGVAVFIGFDAPSNGAPGAKPAGTADKPTRDAAAPVAAVSTARPSGAAKAPVTKAALETARGLMAKGQVRAARAQLLALADQASPDAAWDLARSYDPNVLVAVPAADAGPDVKEATRWYRTWYAAAVREGLVADSVSLERIIGSMKQ